MGQFHPRLIAQLRFNSNTELKENADFPSRIQRKFSADFAVKHEKIH